MDKWELWLLIAVVIGVIISNIMLLKQTAHIKLPPFLSKSKLTPEQKAKIAERQQQQKEWDKDSWDNND
ncbi:DUF2897 family protein [Ferrimonas pelagia]|uniref:DUF2897 family protein n=1 Tax=Ferrimonas pelagia TaxID=1177826 RepID=A0ABP9EJR9_9GAMM